MPMITTQLAHRDAPCGQEVAAERLRDRDEECLLTDAITYACGCRDVRHEYHDGSFSRTVTHHDGTTLAHELNAER